MESPQSLRIGEVARRTGLTERTLRYYEELGLLAPARGSGGQREYDAGALARLYRVRLLRDLGTPLAEIDPEDGDLGPVVQRHLLELDERLAALGRLREKVRAVEASLLRHDRPTDDELIGLLAGMPAEEPALTRRITLLVYRDLEAGADFLVTVFGLGAGPLHRDESGTVVHAELSAGDGLLWLHRVAPEFGLASPASLGAATACMAVWVDDLDAHHERVAGAGAEVVNPPRTMPYGVREYDARDPEGHLWSFMQALEGETDE